MYKCTYRRDLPNTEASYNIFCSSESSNMKLQNLKTNKFFIPFKSEDFVYLNQIWYRSGQYGQCGHCYLMKTWKTSDTNGGDSILQKLFLDCYLPQVCVGVSWLSALLCYFSCFYPRNSSQINPLGALVCSIEQP